MMKRQTSHAKRVLVTAGPTREYIDPVRYLSNDSSGQMGFALARAAAHLGGEVTLVAGPVELATPEGITRIDVLSARDMHAQVKRLAPKMDLIIMAAAVADWRPRRMAKQKRKKTVGPSNHRTIELIENPDILTELGKRKPSHQILVGFALETKDLERNARKKLKVKACDWIVANHANVIGAKTARALLIPSEGKKIALPQLPKEDLALVILSHVLG